MEGNITHYLLFKWDFIIFVLSLFSCAESDCGTKYSKRKIPKRIGSCDMLTFCLIRICPLSRKEHYIFFIFTRTVGAYTPLFTQKGYFPTLSDWPVLVRRPALWMHRYEVCAYCRCFLAQRVIAEQNTANPDSWSIYPAFHSKGIFPYLIRPILPYSSEVITVSGDVGHVDLQRIGTDL